MPEDADLRALRDAGIIDDAKLAEIRGFLDSRTSAPARRSATAARFDLTHVLWYAGALIVMGAMSLFTNAAFNALGGWALAGCGAVYALVLLGAGHAMWRNAQLRTPAGLLIATAVSMVPLIIYGIQDANGMWDSLQGDPGTYKNFYAYVKGGWIIMEAATIVAAALAVWRYPFPFILLIAAIALWFMSMDLAMWFTSSPQSYDDWAVRREISMWFGVLMIAAAWAMDVLRDENSPDFPFWIHVFGVLAFWGGMTLHDGGTELQKFVYCLICIGLLGLSVFLDRRVYAVFGALGIATYLGYLSYSVFDDAIAFSFALSLIGLGVIGIGLLLHRNSARIERALETMLPEALTRLRPHHAR